MLPGSTQPVSGSEGVRIEVGKGIAVTGNSVYNVGGPGILFNSRLENAGSSYFTNTSTCVASGCTTPSGHQLWSADVSTSVGPVSFMSNGNSASVTFTSGAITTVGTNTAYTDSTTGHYVEGTGSQKICPNSGCSSASFAAGTIFYVNISCSMGGNCLGGPMNLLTLPVWRFAIGSPGTIQAGDFQLCLSSQQALVAPESCTDIPQILVTKPQYIEIIPANWAQTFDGPGVQSFGLVAKAGGTTGTYTNIWVDDFAVDVPGRTASIVVSGNTVYRSEGAGIATSGGASRFAITGNTIVDPGWDTTGTALGAALGIDVDNGLTGSTLIKGPPLVGGVIEGNSILTTVNTTSSSATCIKLNVVNSGSIDQVRVGTTNLCSSADWATLFDPTTATNYGSQLIGGIGLGGTAPTCTSTGLGTGGGCNVNGTDSSGTVQLSAGTGASSTGTVTLSFSTASLNAPSCEWTLTSTSAPFYNWTRSATAIGIPATQSNVTVTWTDTGGVLANLATYGISYACLGH